MRKSDVFDAISQFRGHSISTFMSANPKKITEYTNAHYTFPLKVVTNEKGEAVGEVLTIIC